MTLHILSDLPFTPSLPNTEYELPPWGTMGLLLFFGVVGWALVICWARFIWSIL